MICFDMTRSEADVGPYCTDTNVWLCMAEYVCVIVMCAGDLEDAIMAMVAADQQEQLKALADSMNTAPVAAGAR